MQQGHASNATSHVTNEKKYVLVCIPLDRHRVRSVTVSRLCHAVLGILAHCDCHADACTAYSPWKLRQIKILFLVVQKILYYFHI